MYLEVIVGAIVVVCVAIVIYLFTRPKDPVTITKRADGGQAVIRIRANRGLRSVAVSDNREGGVFLKRTGLKRGDVVEFQVPLSQNPMKVIVEDEEGAGSQEFSV